MGRRTPRRNFGDRELGQNDQGALRVLSAVVGVSLSLEVLGPENTRSHSNSTTSRTLLHIRRAIPSYGCWDCRAPRPDLQFDEP